MTSPATAAKAAQAKAPPTAPTVLAPKHAPASIQDVQLLLNAVSMTSDSVRNLRDELRVSAYESTASRAAYDSIIGNMKDKLDDLTKFMHNLNKSSSMDPHQHQGPSPDLGLTNSVSTINSSPSNVKTSHGCSSLAQDAIAILSTLQTIKQSASTSAPSNVPAKTSAPPSMEGLKTPPSKNPVASKPAAISNPTAPVSVSVPSLKPASVSTVPASHPTPAPKATVPQSQVVPQVQVTQDDPSQNPPPRIVPSPKPMITFHVTKWAKEVKDLVVEDETFDSVISWYEHIQQSLAIATSRHDVLPELNSLSSDFSFKDHILPPETSAVYRAGLSEYTSMSRALRIYLTKPSTIASHCATLKEKQTLHKNQRDGFVLLLILLKSIFPHLGGKYLDVIHEISSLSLEDGDTLDTILHKFISMKRKLDISGHNVPTNALLIRYVDIVKSNTLVFTIISPIVRLLHDHLQQFGPDAPFLIYDIHRIHEYIKMSGFSTEDVFSSQSTPKLLTPHAASAQSGHTPHTRDPKSYVLNTKEPFSTQCAVVPAVTSAQANAVSSTFVYKKMTPRCPICYQRHPANHCWARDEKYQPLWLRRNIKKYNALHPDDPVDEKYVNQSPPLRFAQVNKVTFEEDDKADIISNTQDVQDDLTIDSHCDSVTVVVPDNTSTTISIQDNEYGIESSIVPSCNMVRVNSPWPEPYDDNSFIEA